ncbi:MAG TPA: NAD(P)H-dependent oxidoreductase subunit E [Candidatus Rifleibacterium sp.]|nr:NAD(P)H-dependent oxidoreductase subunit E [Candidatus Rifleibacterium sp.]
MNGQTDTMMRKFEKVCEIIERYHNDSSKLVPILQAVQEEYRYLPEDVMYYVATSLGIPSAQVYGVATFYSHFALTPKGKYLIKVCDGTACHVKKSIPILEALVKKLKLADGRMTTPDMLFTVETVSCLGACGLAPVLVINDEVHGLMTPEASTALIDDIIAREEVK